MIINDMRVGPLSLSEAERLHVGPETPVWRPGLTDWVTAGELPELAASLSRSVDSDESASPACDVEDVATKEVNAEACSTEEVNAEECSTKETGAEPQIKIPRREFTSSSYGAFTPHKPTSGYRMPPKCPPTFLVWNIVVTILCCIPVGVVGLIFSNKVSNEYNKGNYEGALKWSHRAEWCVIIAIVAGVLTFPLQIIISAL